MKSKPAEDKLSSNKAQQELTEIVINKEDVDNIENFFKHFSIELPKYLQEQFSTYRESGDKYSLADQQRLKEELCKALALSEHELLKDELFSSVISRCEDVWFHAQFTRDLEESLLDEESGE